MADDEERTSSDSEAEAIEAAIDDSDEDVRYSLRSRQVSKLTTTSASTSMGVVVDVIGASPAGIEAARGSVAVGAGVGDVDTRLYHTRARRWRDVSICQWRDAGEPWRGSQGGFAISIQPQ